MSKSKEDKSHLVSLGLIILALVVILGCFPKASHAKKTAAEVVLTREPFFSTIGELTEFKSERSIICVKLNLDYQEASVGKNRGVMDIGRLRTGNIVVITLRRQDKSHSDPEINGTVVVGRIVSVDPGGNIVCVEPTESFEDPEGSEPATGMGEDQGLIAGQVVYFKSIVFDVSELRELHLETGGVVRCDSVWIEKGNVRFLRAGGQVGIPIEAVDLPKSLFETLKKQLNGEIFEKIPTFVPATAQRNKQATRSTCGVRTGGVRTV